MDNIEELPNIYDFMLEARKFVLNRLLLTCLKIINELL
ncbi:MAG: hypothetical protein KatS3mg003_2254 [Candidatus Nitrosocaldaceae archaeon]|nr:MAG: hypothetical protein KatS3mg003_2254 [Candidatus Nitrosocaldaceae archaeon]